MRDRSISSADIGRYGEQFLVNAAAWRSLDPDFVDKIVARHRAVLDRWYGVSGQASGSRSSTRMAQGDRAALVRRVVKRLKDLFEELRVASRTVAFDFLAFYPSNTREDVGRSLPGYKQALERCVNALKQYPQIPNSSALLQELEALRAELEAAYQTVDGNVMAKLTDSDEVAAVRAAWWKDYRAAKCYFEGLFIEHGLEDRLADVFPHLKGGRPSSGKKTAEAGDAAAADGSGADTQGAE